MNFELKDYLLILKEKLWVIVLFTFIVGIISYVIIYYYIEDIFYAETTLCVDTRLTKGNAISQMELMAGALLARDYQQLAKSRTVTETVREKLGIKGLTAESIANMVKVNAVNDTRIIKISVQHTDRELTAAVANSISEVFIDKITEIMNIKNVNIIDNAVIPSKPAKPNREMYMIIAVILAFLMGTGIIFLAEYLDNTVRTSEDIEKNIDLPVIGTIPIFEGRTLIISK